MNKRSFLVRTAVLAGIALAAPGALAAAAPDNYPERPIELIVPFPPGGPTDVSARIIGEALSERLGQPVVVQNQAGASGTIGTAAIARARPDGYTIGMLATPALLAPHLLRTDLYDVEKDFTPVSLAYDLPIVLVVNPRELPDVTDLKSLIAKAKATQRGLDYTTAGVGSFGHLTTELLKKEGGFPMVHIAYKGSAPAITDLLGGQVPMMFSDLIAVLPHVQSGKLRPIAVGSPERLPMLPDVPTVAEQGFPGFAAVSWGGVIGPAGLPQPVRSKLSEALASVLGDPSVAQRMLSAGAIAHHSTPDQLAELIHSDYTKWGKVIRENDIGPN